METNGEVKDAIDVTWDKIDCDYIKNIWNYIFSGLVAGIEKEKGDTNYLMYIMIDFYTSVI